MLSCYSFSTFTHVTCSLSVFTIFSLGWEVHPYSNIFTRYTLYIAPITNFRTLTFFGFFGYSAQFGFLVFAHRYLLNLDWFFFLLLLRYFNSQSLLFYGFPVGDSSFISFHSRLFVLFYVLLVLTLVILQIPIYTLPYFMHIKRLELLKPTWKAGGLPVNLCVLMFIT